MEALIQHFLILLAGLHGAGRRAFVPVEGPARPARRSRQRRHQPARARALAVALAGGLSAMEPMVVGALLADVVAIIGSTDIVMGDVDR